MNSDDKIVGILGTNGSIDNPYCRSSDELLNLIGKNTGNLLFQKAVTDSIDESKVFVGRDLAWDIHRTRELCRVLVVPSANFIREKADFTSFVGFMEKVDLPLVFLGLGAQAPNFDQKKFDLHPSVLRLIDLCKERCEKVGVRGAFTQEVLESFGLHNTSVIGCPSNFVNRDPKFREILEKRWQGDSVDSFMVVQNELWPQNSHKLAVERKLLEWAINSSGIVVQQSVESLVKYKRGLNLYGESARDSNFTKVVGEHLAPTIDAKRFKSFVATRLRLYYDVGQWMEDCASFSFCTGLRLHGNMMAWQTGTPAVWLHHDSRTKELVEGMGLPNMSIESAERVESIAELKKLTEFDPEEYFRKRAVLFDRYSSILEESGIKGFSAHVATE